MATTISRTKVARPAKDEWGVYDPEQAGLAALYARLDSKDPKTAKVADTKTTAPKAAAAKPSLR
jgi:hypothetical protein